MNACLKLAPPYNKYILGGGDKYNQTGIYKCIGLVHFTTLLLAIVYSPEDVEANLNRYQITALTFPRLKTLPNIDNFFQNLERMRSPRVFGGVRFAIS